jgi:hypothetical protein
MRIADSYEVERFNGRDTFALGVPLQIDIGASERILARLETNSTGRSRIAMEARLLHSLRSPYLPRLLEAGVDDALGLAFYTMIVRTPIEPLAVAIEQHTLGLKTIWETAVGVSYLHERGVAYRSCSPLGVASAAGQPLLFDFSRAMAIGDSRAALPLSSTTEHDPHEAASLHDGVGSDIYDLGMLLKASTVGELEPLVNSMTDADPNQRPVSMWAVAKQLEEALAHTNAQS